MIETANRFQLRGAGANMLASRRHRSGSILVRHALLLVGLGTVTFVPLKLPGVFFTLSDGLLIGYAIQRLLSNKIPSLPFGRIGSIYAIGLILLGAGLVLSSVLSDRPVAGLIIWSQYTFSFLVIPIILTGLPFQVLIVAIKSFIFGLVVTCLIGLVLYHVEGFHVAHVATGRLYSLLGNPNTLSGVVALSMAPLFLAYFSRALTTMTLLVVLASFAATITLSASFGGLTAALACLAVLVLLTLDRRLLGRVVPACLVAVALAQLLGAIPDVFVERVLSVIREGDVSEAGSLVVRTHLIQEAMDLIEGSPWFGIGPGRMVEISAYGYPVHNTFLLLWAEAGIMAIGGWMLMMGFHAALAIRLWMRRGTREVAACLAAGLVAFLVQGLGHAHLYARYWYIPLGLAAFAAVRAPHGLIGAVVEREETLVAGDPRTSAATGVGRPRRRPLDIDLDGELTVDREIELENSRARLAMRLGAALRRSDMGGRVARSAEPRSPHLEASSSRAPGFVRFWSPAGASRTRIQEALSPVLDGAGRAISTILELASCVGPVVVDGVGRGLARGEEALAHGRSGALALSEFANRKACSGDFGRVLGASQKLAATGLTWIQRSVGAASLWVETRAVDQTRRSAPRRRAPIPADGSGNLVSDASIDWRSIDSAVESLPVPARSMLRALASSPSLLRLVPANWEHALSCLITPCSTAEPHVSGRAAEIRSGPPRSQFPGSASPVSHLEAEAPQLPAEPTPRVARATRRSPSKMVGEAGSATEPQSTRVPRAATAVEPQCAQLAYLMLVHQDPRHFARLIRRLDRSAHFYVHVDARADIAPFLEVSRGLPVTFMRERLPVTPGTITQVKATLALLYNVLRRDRSHAKFVLISGACYPIKPTSHILDVLAADRSRSHLLLFDGRRQPDLAARHPLHDLGDVTPWYGSPYVALSRDRAREVVRTVEAEPRLLDLWYGSEDAAQQLIPTIIGHSAQAGTPEQLPGQIRPDVLAHRLASLHLVAPAGRYFTLDDVGEVQSSPKLFMRKVSSQHSRSLLDTVDRQILGVDASIDRWMGA